MTTNARTLIARSTALVMSVMMLSCGSTQTAAPEAAMKPVDVRFVTVHPGPISRTLEVTGSVVPFRSVQLASPAEGPVVNLRVREGDRVRQGDTLLVIGRREGAEAQITSLAELVRKEEAHWARIERLVAIDGSSQEQRDEASSALESARAQLIKVQEAARDHAILAPWSGVTSRLLVQVGDYNYISPRQPLIELYDPTSLVIRLNVPESHAAHLSPTAPVTVSLDAFPDSVFKATVTRVYPFLDEHMRTRTVEATVVGDVPLLPGMFARTILQTDVIEAALVVPGQALTTATDGSVVVFLAAQGKARRRTVRTGVESAGRVQIVDGLQPGDSVIISGLTGLADGRPIHGVEEGAQTTAAPSVREPAVADTVGGVP